MNQPAEHINWDILAHKYLAGEANAQEQAILVAWIQESPANKKEYLAFKKDFDTAQYDRRLSLFDADEAFMNFEADTIQTRQPATIKTIAFDYYVKIGSVAALIILGMGLLYLFQPVALKTVTLATNNHSNIDTIPDGSIITLNKNTTVYYATDFDHETRNVTLQNGEAFFEITHNPEKPFIISAGSIAVKVLGTSFNLQYDSIADALQIAVASGSVQVYSTACLDTLILTKDQLASYEPKLCNTSVINATNNNEHAWRTKKLTFTDAPLPEVIPAINKMYGVNFQLSDSLKNCRFNAKLNDQSIEEVISILEITFDAEIKKHESSTYTIDGNKCD